jgi:hypothetical protein
MNENNSKKPDEGRLIDYLLNESSPEERVEIESLCGENSDWQQAKSKLERTLGLIEDACKQPATGIEGGMELDPGRRKELESLRSGEPVESGEQAEQEAETEERILIFKPAVWVPLAAAACAALLVWGPDSMDRETPEQHLAAAEPKAKDGKNESSPATGTDKATLRSGKLGLAQSDDANADPSASIVSKGARLKENQDKSEGASLELEEDLTIALLESRALDGANEVLNDRSARDVASLNGDIAKDVNRISLADAFARPSAESADFSIGSDSDALPPRPGAPVQSSPAAVSPPPSAPLSKAIEDNPAIEGISSGTSGQGPGVGAGAGFVAGNRNELNPLAEDGKGLALRRAASDDRLAINKPQNSAAGFTIDTVRGRELSSNGVTAKKTRKDSTLYSAVDQKRSKPASWTALVRKPSTCFLFNKDGQALGQVLVSQSEGKTSVIRRMGEIRQGKRFLLTPGQFELRMTDQSGAVVILSGELKRKANLSAAEGTKEAEAESKATRDGDYEFEAKEAWWLDQSEVRQALPVNELVR